MSKYAVDDYFIDQFNKEDNGYIGCSQEELGKREMLLERLIVDNQEQIKELTEQFNKLKDSNIGCINGKNKKMLLEAWRKDNQAHINALTEELNKFKQELAYVNEAKKYVNKIAIETCIYVEKTKKSRRVGNSDKVKYYVAYDFVVYQANASDNTKARKKLFQSDYYASDMKSNMMSDMVKCIKQNNIKKVYLEQDVKIAEKQLEKVGVTIIK